MNSGTSTQPVFHELSTFQRDTLHLFANPRLFDRWPLDELLTEWQRSAHDLTTSLLRQESTPPPFQVARAALDVLAVGRALADRVLADRWVVATDALRYGAEPRTVAMAMGITEEGLRDGLADWADQQVAVGKLTERQRHDLLMPLIREKQNRQNTTRESKPEHRPPRPSRPRGSLWPPLWFSRRRLRTG